MAKKKKIVEEHKSEPVTNCDQSQEPVAKCDQLVKVDANGNHLDSEDIVLSQYDIEKLIITIRGKQVLIDRDLGKIYGVETKRLNEQVRRNIARFPDRYRFQLTKDEMQELVANCDRFKTLKHSTSAPYAFTVFGVSMLPSVLNSQKAIETSIRIIDAFVAMRSFMVQNADILTRITHLERHQIDTDEKIDMILDKMEESSPRVLSLLMKRGKGVSATIHSRFTKDFLTDLEKHNTQYDEVKFVQLPHKNHDRFLIIDDSVYLLGASVKDMGNGLCAVTKLQALPETILGMLK